MMTFLDELKRRNVFKVAAAYAAVAWMFLELSALALNAFSAPTWVMKVIIFLVVAGFAVAVLLAWALELTPEGFRLTPAAEAGTLQSAPVSRKLTTITIAALALTLAVVVLDAYVFEDAPDQPEVAGSEAAASEIPAVLTAGTTAGELLQVEASLAADEKSLAILPFENLSSDPEQEYFADGLTEELINTLAEVDGLLVTGRTSAFYFKNSAQPLNEIASTLGVANIVQGSVRKSGTQLRIAVQLIAIDSGFTLWTETFDRQLDDIFVIQDEIAGAVTTALSVTLGAGRFDRPGMTRSVEAYDAYMQARKHGMEYSILDSIVQAERSVNIDPAFAVGWLEVAAAYSQALIYLPIDQTSGYAEKRNAAITSAEALAPDMESFLLRKVSDLRAAKDYFGAEQLLQTYIETYSQNEEFYTAYSSLMLLVGRYEEGIRWGERARRLNPLSSDPANMLGRNLVNSSRSPDITRGELARGIALGGSVPVFSANLAFLEMAQGDWQAALAATQNMVATKDVQSQMLQYLIDGKVQEGLAELRTLFADETLQPALRGRHLPAFAALFGDAELALAFMVSQRGVLDLGLPFFSEVRRLPGFKTWVEQEGLLAYWRTSGTWADFCRPVGDDFECF